MKYIVTLLFLINIANAQDSIKVTISVQNRDLESLGVLLTVSPQMENVYDSVKAKYRVPVPPTGPTTGVSVTAYTTDWVLLMTLIRYNPIFLKSGTAARIETLLRAVNQVYLTARLDLFDTSDTDEFITLRTLGRIKLRRL